MASRADNIASNLSLANFGKATELKNRMWFTIGALIVFRFLTFVPLPGINPVMLKQFLDRSAGGILDFFNMFSGGALANYSLISLGVMPYITASIVVQLAASLHPALAALKKEGESGRKKLNQYSRYGAVALTLIQGYFILKNAEVQGFAVDPGMLFYIAGLTSLVGGTMFLLWLGEQITSRGIGNGTSLIIMAGIVAQMPTFFANLFEGGRTGSIGMFVIVAMLLLLVAMVLIDLFHGARPAPAAGAISQARQPARHDAGGSQPPAAQDQHRRRDSADLRQFVAAAAADHQPVRRQFAVTRFDDGRLRHIAQPVSRARQAALHDPLCRRDRLLQLLLHGRGVQSGRDRRKSEARRRLHPWHSPGQEHRDLPRLCAHPHHRDRRDLYRRRLCRSRILDGADWHAS